MYYFYNNKWLTLKELRAEASKEGYDFNTPESYGEFKKFLQVHNIKQSDTKPSDFKLPSGEIVEIQVGPNTTIQEKFDQITPYLDEATYTNLNQKINKIQKARDNSKIADDLVKKVKELGLYSYGIYGKTYEETIENANNLINQFESSKQGVGKYSWLQDEPEFIGADVNTDKPYDPTVSVWYEGHKKRLDNKYSFLSPSVLNLVFTKQDEDAAKLLESIIPFDDYKVDYSNFNIGINQDYIDVTVGDEKVRLRTNLKPIFDNTEEFNEAIKRESAKLFYFLEKVEGKTAINDLKSLKETADAGEPIYNAVTGISSDLGGIGLSSKQNQELNYIVDRKPNGEWGSNIFQKEEQVWVSDDTEISTDGMMQGGGGYYKTVVINPFQEEWDYAGKVADQEIIKGALTVENKSAYQEALARSIIYGKKRDGFIKANIQNFMDDGANNPELINMLAKKNFNIGDLDIKSIVSIQEARNLDKVEQEVEKAKTSIAIATAEEAELLNNDRNYFYTNYVDRALEKNDRVIDSNGEEIVYITKGDLTASVPKSIADGYFREQQAFQDAKATVDEAKNSYFDLLETQADANKAFAEYAKNYDKIEKLGFNLLWGTGDLVMGMSRAVTYVASPITPADVRKDMDEFYISYQKLKTENKASFYEDLTTGDAFESVSNFGEASAQVITQQLPNLLAAIFLTPAGAATVYGLSSAGTKGIEMDYENYQLKKALNEGTIDLNTYMENKIGGGEYFGKMLGYGLTEGLITRYFGTIRNIQAGKNIVAKMKDIGQGSIVYRGGYGRYFVKEGLPELGTAMMHEQIEENFINIGQNIIDGRDPMENADYVTFSSGLFGFGLGSINVGLSMINKRLSDYKSYKEIQGRFKFETQLNQENNYLEAQNKKLAEKGGEEILIKENQDKIDNNKEIIASLQEQNIADLDGLEKRYKDQGFTEDAWYDFRDGLVNMEKLRMQAEDIQNDKTKSKKQREQEAKNVYGQLALTQKFYNIFTSVERFGNRWAALNMNSSTLTTKGRRNRSIIKKYKQDASRKLAQEYNKFSKEQVENLAEKMYNEDQVKEYAERAASVAGQFDIDFRAFDTNKELIDYLNETYRSLIETARENGNEDFARQLETELNDYVYKINKGTLNGLDIGDLDQTVISIENAAKNGLYATGIHEISHAIARKALNISDEGFYNVGNAIVNYLKNTDETMLQKIFVKNRNALNQDGTLKDGEEMFASFMEFLSAGEIDIDAAKAANLLGVLGFEINQAIEQLSPDAKIPFTGQDQILNFLTGLDLNIKQSKNVRDINVPNELRRGIASEDAKAKTSMSETGRPASVDQQQRKKDVNKLVEDSNLPKSGTLKEWIQTPEGQIFAGKVLPRYYQDAYNTALRQRNITTEEQLFDPSEIAQQTMLEMLIHLGNFNVSNTDLDGYLAGFLGKKTGTAKKKIKKKIKTRPTEAKDQGRMVAQETTTQVDNRKPTILEEEVFEPTVLEKIKAKVSKIIPTIKQKIDQAVSKNKRTTPFIAQAKADISRLAEPIIKKAMGGKANNKLRDFLTGNKDAIVNNLTTTFLMGKDTKGKVLGGIPQAIQKSVGGEYQVDRFGNRVKDDNGNDIFIPNWLSYPDWVGKKADLEKAATTGRTSGADLVRRHPNVEEFVTDEDILSRFFTPEGELIRGRKEAIAKQLANEVGLEIFEQDINEQGPIFDMFKDSQELQGVLLADNVAADIRRQIDRGGTKASEARQIMDFFDENLTKNTAEQQVAFDALPQSLQDLMIENGLDYLITPAVNGYRAPVMRVSWLGFEKYKDIYRATNLSPTSENIKVSMDQLADAVNKVVDNIDFSLFAAMTPSQVRLFLHLSSRGLGLIKDTQKYKALETKINNKLKTYKDKKKIQKFIDENGFNPRDIRLFNASYGIYGKIQDILNTADGNKLVQIEDTYGNQLAGANIANIRAVGYLYKQKLKTLVENESLTPGLIRMNEANTNNTKSVRMWSRTGSIEIKEGIIQAPLIGPNGKGYSRKADAPESIKDQLEINRNHPHFELANELAQYRVSQFVEKNPNASDAKIQKKYNDVLEEGLRYKGEHALASALLNYEITLKMFEYGTRIQEQPSQKENLLKQFEEEVLKIARDYDQELGTKAVFDLQDDALGRTSKLGFLRGRVTKILQNDFYNPLNGDNKKTMQEKQIMDRAYYDKIAQSKIETAKPNSELRDDSKVIPKTRASETTAGMLGDFSNLDNALDNARSLDKPIKKIRVFDFDDTLARTKSTVFYTKPDGTKGQLTAEEFAEKGADLVAEGAVMDFSDFNIVREGERGPMFEIAERIRDARGTEDVFVLTARSPESASAIHEFLKSEGLDIPIKNITGLGNSTGEAKAQWLVGKAAEGYNDFYFTDDAIQNVEAVSIAMEALDVKSKVQQARTKLSETLDSEFNIILEQSTGVESYKRFSKARAQTGIDRQRKFRGFMPSSAQDFEGLLYRFLGKGEIGNRQYEWFKENLLDPLNRAEMNMSQDRINIMNDFKTLKNNLSVPVSLKNNAFDGFKNQDVVRMYIWLSQGMDIPGASKSAIAKVKKHMAENPELITFAENIKQSLKGNEYTSPGEAWQAGTITTDLIETLNDSIRKGYLKEFREKADIIFSPENLNKIEAIYGSKFREALENSLTRIKAGRNRIFSNSRLTNNLLDYINNSQGVIMFLNMRSAVLQGISNINFLNWSFNNPLKAGLAFANQGQYWKDFMMLMNSDYLVDRRQGLRININEAEIANAAATSKNKAKAAVSWIIQKGYAPTTFMDSFAIASGGATFYRNRINDLMKNEGLTEEEAKVRAMEDFREIAEKTQQSSRPDKISAQQAGDLGRIVLAFANTPMQYNRLINKAMLDLANGRGDYKSNISKIMYYGVIQNLIFNSLQQAVFALGFGDDAADEEKEEKLIATLEGSLDSILRGTGVGGAAIYTLKNVIMDIYERSERSRPEYVDAVWEVASFSPPIDSKISRLKGAAWYFDSKKRRQEIFDKGFSLDNPAYMAFAKVIAATTNVPLDRALIKIENINDAFASDTETWMRIAILLGWPKWTLESKGDKELTKEKKDLEYKKKNLYKFNKWEQESILKQYGVSDRIIKRLNSEEERVDKIESLKIERDTLFLPKLEDKPISGQSKNRRKKKGITFI